LGNDYLVFEEGAGWIATNKNVERVCDRFRGIGSDGIVALLRSTEVGSPSHGVSGDEAEVELRMFNPDGREFERSGNGLRILGSYLARRSPSLRSITAHVGGDRVGMKIHGRSGPQHDISVDMGRALIGPAAVDADRSTFGSTDEDVGWTGAGGAQIASSRPAPQTWMIAGPEGELLVVVPVSVGNPHIVVLVDGPDLLSEARLAEVGPFLTAHPALRFGANVQLALAGESGTCQALIWERGVGRTSASGTSSCAVAVAMVVSGRMHPGEIQVEMPGGALSVVVTERLDVILRGPVEEVIEGALSEALLATFERAP
jgi:diaminopimelate epimerase